MKTKHELKRELSYKKILDASLRVFSKEGYNNATIESITKEAGYTKGAFYVHFTSKEECFLLLMNERLSDFTNQLLELLSNQESVQNIIKKGVSTIFNSMEKDNWAPIFFEFYSHALRNTEIKNKMSEHYNHWLELVALILKQAQTSQQISKDLDPKQIASIIVGIIDGLNLQRNVTGKKIDKRVVETMILKILEIEEGEKHD